MRRKEPTRNRIACAKAYTKFYPDFDKIAHSIMGAIPCERLVAEDIFAEFCERRSIACPWIHIDMWESNSK